MRQIRNLFFGITVELAYAALIIVGGFLVVAFFQIFMKL